MLLAAALLYFISPLDAVPDVVPVVGYADDLAVLLFILERLRQALKAFVTELVQHNVDLTIEKFDQTANRSVDRVVTTISIGFWAATSMAAISLIVQQVNHGLPVAWHAYMVSVAGLTLVWNGAVAIEFYGKFRKLDAPWRDRILNVVTARLGWSHALRVGFPVVLWLAFAGMRMLAV